MTRFTGSIASLETAIKDLATYVDSVKAPRALHTLETELLALAMRIALASLGQCISQGGTGHVGPVHTDAEGGERRLLDDARPLVYRSLFGPLEILRAYYHDRELGGLHPLDAQVALPERSYSYHLQQAVALLGTQNAYEEGEETLFDLLGIRIPKSMGEKLVADMASHVAAFREQLRPPAKEGPVTIVQADAKGVNMVRPVEKAPPGPKLSFKPAERQGKKKMANAWTIYTATPDPGTPPVPLNRTTSATMATKREAFTLMLLDLARRGPTAGVVLFLADGDPVLDALQQELLPRAVSCLDWMHLQERVWEAAYVFHPKGSAEATIWVKKTNARLMNDDVATVLRGLRQSLTKGQKRLSAGRKAALASVIGYMEANKHRMPYGTFMLKGYPIGTGSIEGGVRHLIGDRMDRTGMRWTEAGAQAMLDLRSIHVNGQVADFHAHRISREQERLYGANRPFQADLCG